MAVNAGGAVNLVEAALALPDGPRHIVSMSSLAASGPCPDGRCLDEDEEPRPLTPYGRSKAALEAALRPYEGRMSCTFIRAPGVYGPRDRDFLQYFKLVRRGLRVIVGDRNVMSIVYVKTLAQAIVDCVLNPAAYGQAFFIADEGEYDWDAFSAMVEKSLARPGREDPARPCPAMVRGRRRLLRRGRQAFHEATAAPRPAQAPGDAPAPLGRLHGEGRAAPRIQAADQQRRRDSRNRPLVPSEGLDLRLSTLHSQPFFKNVSS